LTCVQTGPTKNVVTVKRMTDLKVNVDKDEFEHRVREIDRDIRREKDTQARNAKLADQYKRAAAIWPSDSDQFRAQQSQADRFAAIVDASNDKLLVLQREKDKLTDSAPFAISERRERQLTEAAVDEARSDDDPETAADRERVYLYVAIAVLVVVAVTVLVWAVRSSGTQVVSSAPPAFAQPQPQKQPQVGNVQFQPIVQ